MNTRSGQVRLDDVFVWHCMVQALGLVVTRTDETISTFAYDTAYDDKGHRVGELIYLTDSYSPIAQGTLSSGWIDESVMEKSNVPKQEGVL